VTGIAEFIANQFDHDEREIRRRLAIPAGWAHDGPCVNYEGQDPEDRDEYDSCSRHVAAAEARRADRFPYRDLNFALRQVTAGRRILARHRPYEGRCTYCMEWCECPGVQPVRDCACRGNLPSPCPDLRDLASVYADRDGYDPGWVAD
jgi:hypothetical protein